MDPALRHIIDGALKAAGTMQSPVPSDERDSIAWAAAGEAWSVFPGGDPGGFAATVTRRRVIAEARKVHGKTRDGVCHPVFPRATVPDRLVVDDYGLGVEAFCADMPADVQLVVRRLAQGWRPNEIAVELGRTPGRVSQLIAKARAGDRDLLVA